MKITAFFLLAAIYCACAVFPQSSAGVAGDVNIFSNNLRADYGQDRSEVVIETINIKAGLFCDLKYIELGIDYVHFISGEAELSGDFGNGTTGIERTIKYLGFHVYAKYPFSLKRFTIYPAGGMEYLHNIQLLDADGNNMKTSMTAYEKDNLNMLWIKLGGGADFNVNGKCYIRNTMLFGYKLNSQQEKNEIDALIASGYDSAEYLSFDFDFGLGIGFRL